MGELTIKNATSRLILVKQKKTKNKQKQNGKNAFLSAGFSLLKWNILTAEMKS